MSIRVIDWVLKHSRTRHATDQLVLLVIANYCHDDGTGAWPSLPRIAREARVDPKTVKRAVGRLEQVGDLSVERCGGGRKSHRYAICLSNVPGTASPPGQRAPGSPGPLTRVAQSPDPGQRAPRSLSDPSDNREAWILSFDDRQRTLVSTMRADRERWWRVGELSRLTGIPKEAVKGRLQTLAKRGAVRTDEETTGFAYHYQLSPEATDRVAA